MALAIAAVSLPAAFAQQPDPKELIRESIQKYDKDWRARMNWAYTQNDVTCAGGKKEVDVSTVFPLDGTPYERLISKDGQPLSPEEQRKEEEKYQKEKKRRESESPADRAVRIQKFDKERSFLADIPAAYNVKLAGEEVLNGRPAWIVQFTPRPGFEPTAPHASLLKHIDGKLWIDKKDLQWAKAEADVIEAVSIGLIVARIGPGAHITLDFTRISESLWVPKEITIKGEAKILLVHNKDLDEQLTFTNYHLPAPATQVANR